jgi:hypothetical protein
MMIEQESEDYETRLFNDPIAMRLREFGLDPDRDAHESKYKTLLTCVKALGAATGAAQAKFNAMLPPIGLRLGRNG